MARGRRHAVCVTVLACVLAVAGTAQAESTRAKKPDVVSVGGLINDVRQLDLQSHSYNVDMYLWFKWENPEIDPSRSFEFLNAF